MTNYSVVMMECGLLIFGLSALVVLPPVADAFPTGAASMACVTMAPRHRSTADPDRVIAPQESISPYSIKARGTGYTPGGTVTGESKTTGDSLVVSASFLMFPLVPF